MLKSRSHGLSTVCTPMRLGRGQRWIAMKITTSEPESQQSCIKAKLVVFHIEVVCPTDLVKASAEKELQQRCLSIETTTTTTIAAIAI